MDMTLLYLDGCPSWQTADRHPAAPAGELGLTVTRRTVRTAEGAGAPTRAQLGAALRTAVAR